MLSLMDITPIASAVSRARNECVALSWFVTPIGVPNVFPISIRRTPVTSVAPLGAYRDNPSASALILDSSCLVSGLEAMYSDSVF